jgi:hypothetical protein
MNFPGVRLVDLHATVSDGEFHSRTSSWFLGLEYRMYMDSARTSTQPASDPPVEVKDRVDG